MPSKSIAIIGGGISGLTAAFALHRTGIPVTVYEAAGRVGGTIQSIRKAGYLAEFGPNTILETSPLIRDLIRDAGLESRRLDPAPEAGARFVVNGKRPVEMPGSPIGFFTTPIFSPRAKLSVLAEPFVPARRDGVEESVADFVVRRLGREFLDRAIDAMVAGVYAGDPTRLSLQQAFPKLAALEAKYGSLVKGQILGARERRKRGEIAKDRAPKFSFDEGLQVLPDSLHSQLPDVRLQTKVESLTRMEEGRWIVESSNSDGAFRAEHSAVIHAGTAHGLAKIRIGPGVGVEPQLSDLAAFSEVRHPPVASVVLGFRREDVAHPCQGFGALIPRIENFSILGTIFSSSLFPNRAPAGHLTLTSYLGGERQPAMAGLPDSEILAVTLADLRTLFGVTGPPTFHHIARYPQAIPQYNLGYARFRQILTDAETVLPGLFFAGHYRDGISLGDSIVSGMKMAARVAGIHASLPSSGL